MDKCPEADAGGPTQGGPGPSRAAQRRRIRTTRKADAEAHQSQPHAQCEHGNPPVGEVEGGLGASPVSGRRQLRGRALGGWGVRLGYHLDPLVRLIGGLLLCCRSGTSGLHQARGGRRAGGVGRAAPGPPPPAAPRGRRSRWARARRAAPTARDPPDGRVRRIRRATPTGRTGDRARWMRRSWPRNRWERGASGRFGGGRRRGRERGGRRARDGRDGGRPGGSPERDFSYTAGDVANDLLSFVGKPKESSNRSRMLDAGHCIRKTPCVQSRRPHSTAVRGGATPGRWGPTGSPALPHPCFVPIACPSERTTTVNNGATSPSHLPPDNEFSQAEVLPLRKRRRFPS